VHVLGKQSLARAHCLHGVRAVVIVTNLDMQEILLLHRRLLAGRVGTLLFLLRLLLRGDLNSCRFSILLRLFLVFSLLSCTLSLIGSTLLLFGLGALLLFEFAADLVTHPVVLALAESHDTVDLREDLVQDYRLICPGVLRSHSLSLAFSSGFAFDDRWLGSLQLLQLYDHVELHGTRAVLLLQAKLGQPLLD